MKKFYYLLLTAALPLFLISCSSDSDDDVALNQFVGKTFRDSKTGDVNNWSYTYGDSEAKRMIEAVSFVPRDKYTSSSTHKDTLLSIRESSTQTLTLHFESKTKATLSDYTKKNVTAQKVEIYRDKYKFTGNYYVENNLFMVNIVSNMFTVYDKTKSKRYDFRLDGNYGCEIVFYIKRGGTQEYSTDKTENYEYPYEYVPSENYLKFTDSQGKYFYMIVYEVNIQGKMEYNLSFQYDKKYYNLMEVK